MDLVATQWRYSAPLRSSVKAHSHSSEMCATHGCGVKVQTKRNCACEGRIREMCWGPFASMGLGWNIKINNAMGRRCVLVFFKMRSENSPQFTLLGEGVRRHPPLSTRRIHASVTRSRPRWSGRRWGTITKKRNENWDDWQLWGREAGGQEVDPVAAGDSFLWVERLGEAPWTFVGTVYRSIRKISICK